MGEEEGKEGKGAFIKRTAKTKAWWNSMPLSGLKIANSLVMDYKGRDRKASPLEGPLDLTLDVSIISLNLPLSMNKLFWEMVNSLSMPAFKQLWMIGDKEY